MENTGLKEPRYEICLTGSGGQGVILISVILAEAAVIAGYHTVQSQAYGPEARGGLCKADTIISKEEIWFTKPQKTNTLLALTQASLDHFCTQVTDGALIIADSSLKVPEGISNVKFVQYPILQAAKEKVGRQQTANIIAVAVINRELGFFSNEVLTEAVKRHIPAGTEEINNKALSVGLELEPTYSRDRVL